LVDGRERLIQNPHGMPLKIQPRQRHTAMLSGGQVMAGNILEAPQANLLQRLPDGLDRYRLAQSTEPAQIFLGSQRALDRRSVPDEQPMATPVFLTGTMKDRPTAIMDLARRRRQQPGHNAQ